MKRKNKTKKPKKFPFNKIWKQFMYSMETAD